MTADKQTLLVEMVSEQTIPNLIPALDERLGVTHILLLYTEEFRRPKEAIKSIWNSRHAGRYYEKLVPAFDMSALEKACQEIRKKIGQGRVILNATCGTKIMAMAAYSALKDIADVIYVNTAGKKILFLSDPNGLSLPFRPCLDLTDYLEAYGRKHIKMRTAWSDGEKPPVIHDSAHMLLQIGLEQPAFIRSLNKAAWQIETRRSRTPSEPVALRMEGLSPEVEKNINESFREDRLAAQISAGEIVFGDKEALYYLSGEWFEWVVYSNTLDAGVQEAILGLKLEDSRSGSGFLENEFDIAMIKENRLFILECKTVNWEGSRAEEKADAVYKLDSLRRSVAGLYGRAALVSFFPVPEFILQRAEALGIVVFGPEDIPDLSPRLRSWMA